MNQLPEIFLITAGKTFIHQAGKMPELVSDITTDEIINLFIENKVKEMKWHQGS